MPRTHSGGLAAALAGTNGLDAAAGLELLGGRIDAYARILRRYAATYRQGMAKIEAALATRSTAAIGAAGHSLRGASSSIGATAIEQMAIELEAMGGKSDLGDDEERLARDVQRCLIGTVVRIDAALAAA